MKSITDKNKTVLGFPLLIDYCSIDDLDEVLMDFIGPSLKEIYSDDSVDMEQKYCYILQILNRVETIHDLGFIHGDLKLQNIVVAQNDHTKLFLIDFGLSEVFKTPEGHVPVKTVDTFTGNLKFASINQCSGYQKTRRDDYESVFYILLYMINPILPWSHIY